MIALIIAQGILLTVRFDAPDPLPADPWWVQIVGFAPDTLRMLAASGAVLLLLIVARIKTVNEPYNAIVEHEWRPWLLLNLVLFFTLFLFIAQTGIGEKSVEQRVSAGELAGCVGLAIGGAITWFLTLAPFCFWQRFLIRERFALLIAIMGGVLALVLGEIARSYWRSLADGTLFLAECILRLRYADIVSDSSNYILGTSTFSIEIAPSCSGYEGMGLIMIFVAFYLWLFRSHVKFPQALILFPIGLLVVWLANSIRIAALIAIGTSYSPELAMGGFHSQAGWLSFIATASGIIGITHRVGFFSSMRATDADKEKNEIVSSLLVPFLVLMASSIITSMLSRDFDRWYAVRLIAVMVTLVWFRRTYLRWNWHWSWLSLCIGLAVFLIWVIFEQDATGDGAGKLTTAMIFTIVTPAEATWWFCSRMIGSVLVIPLVEELAFRGYLLERLAGSRFRTGETTQFTWLSFLVSSIAFGLMHGRWLAGTIAGMGFALAFYQRRRLADAVVSHAVANALVSLYVVITGELSHW